MPQQGARLATGAQRQHVLRSHNAHLLSKGDQLWTGPLASRFPTGATLYLTGMRVAFSRLCSGRDGVSD